MFDPMFDQAAGLRAVVPPSPVKLIPVALTRDCDAAFNAVWMLGAGLSALGHSVVALDAASRESASQPGLSQLLQRGTTAPASTEPWQILPAQTGLEVLLRSATRLNGPHAIAQLACAFAADTVVMLMAPREWLCVLLEDTAARPLVPLTQQPSSVVDAYSALKVLHQAASLSPVLVPVASEGPSELDRQGVSVLQETAWKHLRWQPEVWAVPQGVGSTARDALSQWMLRILESAVQLEGRAEVPVPTGLSHPTMRGALVPQLWSC